MAASAFRPSGGGSEQRPEERPRVLRARVRRRPPLTRRVRLPGGVLWCLSQ